MYIVITGGGKIGEYLAAQMNRKGHEVAVIEQNKTKAERLAQALPNNILVIQGDGCDSTFQADAGCAHADIFVATTGHDDDNLVSCEIAKLVFNVPRAIARVNSPKNAQIFKKMGIEAVSSTAVISRLIEMEVTQGAMYAVMSLSQGDLVLTEVTLPCSMTGKEKAGKRVSELTMPPDSLLVAVGEGSNLSLVSGHTILDPGDTVIVASKQGVEDQVRDMLLNLWS
jgi:trk system potassium uptake protein TrkA